MGRGPADLTQALVEREGRLFARVLQHSHDHAVKQAGRPLDQVEMAEGEGVETPWIEGTHRPSLWLAS